MTQYECQVRPMYLQFVEPSKQNADVIVPTGSGIHSAALDLCVSYMKEIINTNVATRRNKNIMQH